MQRVVGLDVDLVDPERHVGVLAAGALWVAMPCGLLYSALMLAALPASALLGLDAETLRRMLRVMALTRAFNDRMYRGQRQGKTSFYMKCTGEEATSVASAFALADDDMVFPSYRQQGILIARGYPLTEMINQIYSNKADKLKGRQLPIMYSTIEGAL